MFPHAPSSSTSAQTRNALLDDPGPLAGWRLATHRLTCSRTAVGFAAQTRFTLARYRDTSVRATGRGRVRGFPLLVAGRPEMTQRAGHLHSRGGGALACGRPAAWPRSRGGPRSYGAWIGHA